jgi:hypothetical protein
VRAFAARFVRACYQFTRFSFYASAMHRVVSSCSFVSGTRSLRQRVCEPNYAFKPTAGEVCRSNRALRAGGGLTRR